jgi:hypothetical protein
MVASPPAYLLWAVLPLPMQRSGRLECRFARKAEVGAYDRSCRCSCSMR